MIPLYTPPKGGGEPARREMKAKSTMRRAKMHDDCRYKIVCFATFICRMTLENIFCSFRRANIP